MSLTPWNRQEEWYQQMINASTGNYLPSITAQDEGKVLTVENDGSWGVENVPQELPAVETTDKDKYLHTNASTGAVEWSAVEDELPAVTSSDKDKYLHTNDSTGAVEWADAPDGLPAVTDVDAGKVLTVNNSGVWGAQSNLFVVNFQFQLGTGFSADKTFSQIYDAVINGKTVWATYETNTYYLTSYSTSGIYFTRNKYGNKRYETILIGSSNEVFMINTPLLPDPVSITNTLRAGYIDGVLGWVDEIFYAYGSTSFSDVMSAINSGKVVLYKETAMSAEALQYCGYDNANIWFSRVVEIDGLKYIKLATFTEGNVSISYIPQMPDVSDSDEGKTLEVSSLGEWAVVDKRPLVVTLTPNSADYSGTMDATPSEIRDAYESGRTVIGFVDGMGAQFTFTQFSGYSAWGMVMFTIQGVGDVLIKIATDNSSQTYSTTIYTLTPAT